MRKMHAVMAAIILSLSIGVTAMAQGKGVQKRVKKAGCSDCVTCNVSPEQMRKFKLDTIDLRQEMMNKRFDLQRENLKEAPDSAKTAALEADIAALKEKIEAQRKAANLPASICNDRDCPLIGGECGKCGNGKGCDCSCGMKAGSRASCKDCKECSDCGCRECVKQTGCSKCNEKKQPAKSGCKNCNKK